MGSNSRPAQIRTVKLPVRNKSRGDPTTQRVRTSELIRQILSGLANLAIDADLSMGELGEMAKESYVTAASRRATRRNGTLNRSRIAAITGLTRAEVADLLRSPSNRAARDTRSRARRVVDGWCQDRRFSTRSAAPKPLPLTGKDGSFEHLVRLYAGDVPPRAMLDRLMALSLAFIEHPKRNQRGVVHLNANKEPPRLLPAQAQILEAVSSVLAESRSPWIATITVPATDPIELAILRKTIAEKGQVLLSGINAANPRQKRSTKALRVFVGLADALDAPPTQAPDDVRRRQRRKK